MTRDILEAKIEELNEINGTPYSYFMSWHMTEGKSIVSNNHGKFDELKFILDEMLECQACIQGELPFDILIIYYSAHAIVFKKDPNWDFNEDSSENTHEIFAIPNMGTDGDWLYIDGKYGSKIEPVSEEYTTVYVITDSWLDLERHCDFVDVKLDKTEAYKYALDLTNANDFCGHKYEVIEKKLKK